MDVRETIAPEPLRGPRLSPTDILRIGEARSDAVHQVGRRPHDLAAVQAFIDDPGDNSRIGVFRRCSRDLTGGGCTDQGDGQALGNPMTAGCSVHGGPFPEAKPEPGVEPARTLRSLAKGGMRTKG